MFAGYSHSVTGCPVGIQSNSIEMNPLAPCTCMGPLVASLLIHEIQIPQAHQQLGFDVVWELG
jgi:hypothetical protein